MAANEPLLAGATSPKESVTIALVKESPIENRCALSPDVVRRMVNDGYNVVLESGCGTRASFTDDAFTTAGARIVSRAEATHAFKRVQQAEVTAAGKSPS